MSSIDEFLEYSNQVLNANIGYRSKRIIDKVKSIKKLNDTSNLRDFEEFINLIELDTGVIAGKNNATNICSVLRSKAIELNISRQAMEIFNTLRAESSELNITEFLKKINVVDACAFRTKERDMTDNQKPLRLSISNNIDEFLMKHALPTEAIINRYSTYLAYKTCEDIKKIKKDIIEKVKNFVRNTLIRKAIREKTNNFLGVYPQPAQTDIDDFIKHIQLSNPDIQKDELRQQILNEIFYDKLSESRDMDGPTVLALEESTEFAQLLDIISTYNDKKDIIMEMRRQGIFYLIEDEKGVSDKLLDEYIGLIGKIHGIV
ncbi:Uncharacterised protein [uncultured archaeon]|nr:Uncharacterised protein [uncultured archaeon]